MAEETANGAVAANGTGVGTLSLLEHIIADGKMAREESQKAYARDLIGEFVTQILDEHMTVSQDTVAMIEARIAQIDELISNQLNDIMHAHGIPEARSLLARPQLPGEKYRNRHHVEAASVAGQPAGAPR